MQQLGWALQRAFDGALELRRVVNVDQLRAGSPVLEGHDGLAREQEFIEGGRRIRAHQVDLREQFEDVVVLREGQVLILQRLVAGTRVCIHLRVKGDDPAPTAGARQAPHFFIQDVRRAPRRGKGGVVQDHRWLAHRWQGAAVAQERVEFGPAGFRHREMAKPLGHGPELRGIARAGGAIQVEEAADVDVSWLAGVEAMEGLHFHAGEKMRYRVAGRDHREGLPGAHFGNAEQALAGDQILGARAVKEPGGFIAAGADGRLHRPQDGQRITLGAVQQIMLFHLVWRPVGKRATMCRLARSVDRCEIRHDAECVHRRHGRLQRCLSGQCCVVSVHWLRRRSSRGCAASRSSACVCSSRSSRPCVRSRSRASRP